jgi:hypothetical protein
MGAVKPAKTKAAMRAAAPTKLFVILKFLRELVEGLDSTANIGWLKGVWSFFFMLLP